jgi:regulator of replication initiation timing
VFSTEKLELEELALAKEVNQVSSLIEDCVNENSRVALEQTGYEKRYSALVERYDKAMVEFEKIKSDIQLKQAKKEQIQMYLDQMSEQDVLTEFHEDVWVSMVDYLEVGVDGAVDFHFKDGASIKI